MNGHLSYLQKVLIYYRVSVILTVSPVKDTIMRFFVYFHSLAAVLYGGILLAVTSTNGWAQVDAEKISKIDWKDSLALILNILQDLTKETNVVEQYHLYLRAENTYLQIHKSLPSQEAKSTRKEMVQAYNQLPLPPAFINEMGLRFSSHQLSNTMIYWSDPITESIFIDYLNDNNITEDQLQTIFAIEPTKIKFNPEEKRYLTRKPEMPIFGITHDHAEQFVAWISQVSGNDYLLPSVGMVPINDDNPISCWTNTLWKDVDPFKMEAWDMYGGKFYTVYLPSGAVGELPEASLPDVQLHLIVSAREGKKIYCKNMRSKSPVGPK
jgi:hypothetical protein